MWGPHPPLKSTGDKVTPEPKAVATATAAAAAAAKNCCVWDDDSVLYELQGRAGHDRARRLISNCKDG